MTKLEEWRKKYGYSGITLSLLVKRYIEVTVCTGDQAKLAGNILNIIDELAAALDEEDMPCDAS